MYRETCNNFTINTDIKTTDIDNKILRLNNRITSTYWKSTSSSQTPNRSIPWNLEVHRLIQERNKARRKFQRTNNPYYKLIRNMLTHRIHEAITQIKINIWEKKISKLNLQDQSFRNFYKLYNRKKQPPPLLTSSENFTAYSNSDKANLLASSFHSVHLDSVFKITLWWRCQTCSWWHCQLFSFLWLPLSNSSVTTIRYRDAKKQQSSRKWQN